MPRMDGTGPAGLGPGIGFGRGACGSGRGRRQGMRCGCGQGYCYGPGWRRMPADTKENLLERKELLKDELAAIEQELESN